MGSESTGTRSAGLQEQCKPSRCLASRGVENSQPFQLFHYYTRYWR